MPGFWIGASASVGESGTWNAPSIRRRILPAHPEHRRALPTPQAIAAAQAFDLRRLPATTTPTPTPPITRCASTTGAPAARRRLFPVALCRLRGRLQGRRRLFLRQEARVRAQVRRRPALRAPHHQPGVQRSAAAHARAPDHRRRLHAARHRRHGAAGDRAGRRPARRHGRQGPRRPDRRSRRRRAGRGDRQPAGGAARGARAAARLVAGDPGRARAGADAGAARSGRAGRGRVPRLSAHAGCGRGGRVRATPSAMC